MQRDRTHKNILIVPFLVILLVCSGCLTNTTVNNTPSKKDTLIIGVLSADTIYPLNITDNNYWTLIPNIYNNLVEYDEQFRIIPSLAVAWNNPDDLTWRFYLRQGVKFHNGNDFTAEDVRYSIDTYYSGFKSIISDIIILDNYTIEFKTFEPTPILLERLAHMGIIFCHNSTQQPEGQTLVGTGAYRLVDYEINNYTTLERFDDYWGVPPEIKTVVFKAIEDDGERLTALRSGAIDIAEYNIDDKIDQIIQEKNIMLVKYPPLSTYVIGFDLRENGSYGFPDGRNPTADIRVRKAIYQAINITPLINGPFKRLAMPTAQLVTPYIFGYNPAIERLPYNITTSQQLLAEAGYEDGFDIAMDCITEGFEYNAENCYLITQQLAKIGIHVRMNNLSMTEFNTKVLRERNTSMYLYGWGEISMDGGWIYDLFIRSVEDYFGSHNSGYYSNAEVDRLGIAASHEMHPDERLQMLQKGFRIALVNDVVVVPLFSQILFTLTAPDIKFIPRADLRIIVKNIQFT
ncbi:HTH-type transcriptional regulator SgrR [uncultured archaeon]|nr:HTH-type transcriptional regulator SgrR [uncultured archaeon]